MFCDQDLFQYLEQVSSQKFCFTWRREFSCQCEDTTIFGFLAFQANRYGFIAFHFLPIHPIYFPKNGYSYVNYFMPSRGYIFGLCWILYFFCNSLHTLNSIDTVYSGHLLFFIPLFCSYSFLLLQIKQFTSVSCSWLLSFLFQSWWSLNLIHLQNINSAGW